MASMKITYLLISVLLFITLSSHAEAKHNKNITGISPFCKPADNWRLCTRIVNNASTLHDASINTINTALLFAKRVQALTPLIVEAVQDVPSPIKDDIIKTCSESFDSAVEDIEKALECYINGDTGCTDSNLSSAARGECSDVLKQEGESVPIFTKLNDQLTKVVDNALAVVFQRYANQMWGGTATPLV